MDELSLEIAARIVAARESKGWTQYKLSRESDLAQSMLTNIETGKRTPHARSLIKLANALGVSSDYLLGIERS